VRVITLNDDAALIEYGKGIVNELRANMVRVDADFSATPFKAKISNAEQLRAHTMLVIGGRDLEAGAVSVRLHHGGPQGAKPKAEVVVDILANVKDLVSATPPADGNPAWHFECRAVAKQSLPR
jgi:threonyl-tRNA synthetase